MQGWHHDKGLIYYCTANISADKISLPRGQSYTEREYFLTAPNGKIFFFIEFLSLSKFFFLEQ